MQWKFCVELHFEELAARKMQKFNGTFSLFFDKNLKFALTVYAHFISVWFLNLINKTLEIENE